VPSRTDCNLDDEAAGRARKEYAEEARQRRKEEHARIAEANVENQTRLLAIKAKTDDGDGQIGGPHTPWRSKSQMALRGARDELGEVRDALAAKEKERVRQDNKGHRDRLKSSKPTIDDDTEDDATGEARARLKVESAARRKAEKEKLKAVNASYFAKVHSAMPVTDSCIWDDGEGSAGAMRSVVAARSKARKSEEARKLVEWNQKNKERLSKVTAAVDDGDGHHTG